MHKAEIAFWADLGRYLLCPLCHRHSDVSLDNYIPDDGPPQPLNLGLSCVLFHEDPFIAWLWWRNKEPLRTYGQNEYQDIVAPEPPKPPPPDDDRGIYASVL